MTALPKLCWHAKVSAAVSAVALGFVAYKVWQKIASAGANSKKGSNLYETTELLHQYLSFHYGLPEEIGLSKFGPVEAADFARQCGVEALAAAGPTPVKARALDIGCAVGRSSFEIARGVPDVVGIDFSASFIGGCNNLKEHGQLSYSIQTEGLLTSECVAKIDPAIDRSRTTFEVGDACNLRADLGSFGIVLAANLICRLPRPTVFLQRCSSLVAPGGVLVLTTPYTWLADYTPPSEWLGGFVDSAGRPVSGFQGISAVLSRDFDLVSEKDLPFFIRETARKNQWTVAHLTVWRRKQ